MVMAPHFKAVTDSNYQTTINMSAMVCKRCGVVNISRHYGVAMGLCRVSPCLVETFCNQRTYKLVQEKHLFTVHIPVYMTPNYLHYTYLFT